MKNNLKYLIYPIIFLAVLGFVEAGYYQVKASYAQKLLQDAWQESQLTGKNIKPWSWADSWPVFKLQWLSSEHRNKQSRTLMASGVRDDGIKREGIQGDKIQDDGFKDTLVPIQAEYLVLADSSGESLAFGPGLHTPDVLPGEMGNSIIAAHRDTHFKELQDIQVNDLIRIELKDGELREFQVDQIKVVDAEVEVPIVGIAERRLTLVTCYPFESNGDETSLRYLVSAILIDENNKAHNHAGFKQLLETRLPGELIVPNQGSSHPSQLAYRF